MTLVDWDTLRGGRLVEWTADRQPYFRDDTGAQVLAPPWVAKRFDASLPVEIDDRPLDEPGNRAPSRNGPVVVSGINREAEADPTPRNGALTRSIGEQGRRARSPNGPSNRHAWDPPIPFGSHDATGPTFPISALPQWLGAYATDVAVATQTPVDMAAVIGLGCVAAAAGGRARVQVLATWEEPLNLFVVTAMVPASRKSAVFSLLTAPLRDAERSLVDAAAPAIFEARATRDAAEAAARRAQAHAEEIEEASDREAAVQAAAIAALAAEAVIVPVMPRLLADDATPEAVVSLLAEHGRMSVMSAEGGLFGLMRGRYTGGEAWLDPWLKSHAGDAIRVDRRGRPSEYVERPALTVCLAVQPHVLAEAAESRSLRERGMLARFAYCIPASTVGRRETRPPQVTRAVVDRYGEILRALVLSLAEWRYPNEAMLVLAPEADRLLALWQAELEPQLADGASLESIAAWAGKLAGLTVRVAGLLHLAEHLADGWGQPVNEKTMASAITIGRYFLGHAVVAFDLMGTTREVVQARRTVAWLKRERLDQFTERAAFVAMRAHLPTVDELRPVLDLVERHGWIRRRADQRAPQPRGGRPPSPVFDVNPFALR